MITIGTMPQKIKRFFTPVKQHLGLGDYRVLRYQAVVRHLCLVDSA